MAGGHSFAWWLGTIGGLIVLGLLAGEVWERIKAAFLQILDDAFGAQMQDQFGPPLEPGPVDQAGRRVPDDVQ